MPVLPGLLPGVARHGQAAPRMLCKGVDIFSATTDCAAEMVKTGYLLKDSKIADADGPALPHLKISVWNGCVGYRLDKLHVIVAKHADV